MNPDGIFENWRAESALFLLGRRRSAQPATDAGSGDLFG
jgi:hypothetical protein